MKITRPVVVTSMIILLSGCKHSPDMSLLLKEMESHLRQGEFSELKIIADSAKNTNPLDKTLIIKADSFLQIADRIAIDFSLPEGDFIAGLKNRAGDYSQDEYNSWDRNNWLEKRKIDGETRYFKRAASNLILLRNFNLRRHYYDSLNSVSPEIKFRLKHIESVIKAAENNMKMVVPVQMVIHYTLTLNPDAVPDGKLVRCWLPFPKGNLPRQQRIKLISASHENFRIAPDSVTHKTIYMEGKAEKGIPLVFKVTFGYQSEGQYLDPDSIKILPYDRDSEIYRKYTSEQLPHICFTEKIKNLADSITGKDEKPFEILRKIYYWIDNNIPWAGALEYSTIPNIPEYVLKNRRGDCGMQTFLLMSMLRYKGIPVRWQSGWMMPPEYENLHDWCEVYFEGTGWIPVDMSYGLQNSDKRRIEEFYLSGIDSYRLIVNEGVAGNLSPPKKFLRSEPYDFQRGEVEWEGGNLYFDKWDYEIKIEYSEMKDLY